MSAEAKLFLCRACEGEKFDKRKQELTKPGVIVVEEHLCASHFPPKKAIERVLTPAIVGDTKDAKK